MYHLNMCYYMILDGNKIIFGGGMGDREEIADRVISDARLLELLAERDKDVYRLEVELSAAKRKLRDIGELQRVLNELA